MVPKLQINYQAECNHPKNTCGYHVNAKGTAAEPFGKFLAVQL